MTETIKVTSSFLINLMNFSRQHVKNELQAEALASKFKTSSLLTRNDILALGAEPERDHTTNPARKVVRDSPPPVQEEEPQVKITTPDEILLYMEKYLDSMTWITGKNAISMAKWFLDELQHRELTPKEISNILREENVRHMYKDPWMTVDRHLEFVQDELKGARLPGAFDSHKETPPLTEEQIRQLPKYKKDDESSGTRVIDEPDITDDV